MAINHSSSDGLAEDLIRAFVQIGCAESHAKTLLEKAQAEAENGLIDISNQKILSAHIEKITELTEEITNIAELRRSMMLRLFKMYDGDRDWWCMVKHLGVGAYTAWEVYQASDEDPELLEIAMQANKRFIKALCRFLGTEITDCASCFADMMKGVKHGN